MMDFVWGGMLFLSLASGVLTGQGGVVADAMLAGAEEAVQLCINLCGAFMLWMGLMNVAEEAGMVERLSKALQPVVRRLFPASEKAAAPITLNLAANFFGMGSAATPFGLEAMAAMQEGNPTGDTATEDMCLFLCLNASAVELLPTGVLALRTSFACADPYAIVLPTFLSSLVCAGAAVLGCMLGRWWRRRIG
ncbi:MAG: nucleoside recognition domain-containing protein [Clostridia bacterium]|nr:nucleoside recognition domain-containing protein [Clostridia bacterium]